MTEATAFWTEEPGRGALRREALPAPAPDEVMVETLYSGISRGTETLVFSGHVPDSQREVMRAPFQVGTFPGPVKYGYATVGRIVQGPGDRIGQMIFALHPHQDCFVVPTEAAVAIPGVVPPRRAILAANMETALNALWDSGIGPGDRVAVIGLGVVGLLTAWLAHRIPGTEVAAIDIDPAKRGAAAALGLSFVDPATAADAPIGDADVVIHASGHPDGLVTALALAGFEARVLEMSWYGTRPVNLPLGEAFHARRLELRSSQVGAVSPSRRPRWSHARRLAKALDLLADPVLDALIDDEGPFEALPETLAALAAGERHALCHRVIYPAARAPVASE
ncbi:MAG: zinc-binding alcohol dehydrogenase [Alphaproteobacteria bacterium]|nr:zinc-binding alcohol dehydrogenase [Alphaproteobacteria bacterium]